jgi:hypothetical protein
MAAQLRGHGYEPHVPYPGARTPWPMHCVLCGREYQLTVVNAFKGYGCKLCRGTRIDPESAIEVMRQHNFDPLESFPGSSEKWKSRCMLCNNETSVSFGHARRMNGCAKCSNKRKSVASRLSEEEATARLREIGFEPIAPFLGVSRPWLARCITCGRDSQKVLSSGKKGCAYCSRNLVPEDEIDSILDSFGFKPLEEYPGASKPWKLECLKCGNTLKPRLTHLLRGDVKGCKFCRRIARINEAEDARAKGIKLPPTRTVRPKGIDPYEESEALKFLEENDLIPLESFPGASTSKWKLQCKICCERTDQYFWQLRSGKARPCSKCGRGGTLIGARKVGGPPRMSHDEAAAIMRAAGYEPLEKYKSVSSPWRCRCTKCSSEVAPALVSVRKGHGCQVCAGQVVDPAKAEQIMRAMGYEPLVPYPRANSPWKSRCLKCGHESAPRFNSVQKETRCRYCSRLNLHPDDAVEMMLAVGLEPLVPYPGTSVPWKCRCTNCGRTVSPRVGNARRAKGCRYCSTGGFDFTAPSVVYLITHPEWQAHKIGITNVSSGRLAKHARRGWVVYQTLETDGDKAWDIEKAILSWWRDDMGMPAYLQPGVDGHSETVSSSLISLEEVWSQVVAIAANIAESNSE